MRVTDRLRKWIGKRIVGTLHDPEVMQALFGNTQGPYHGATVNRLNMDWIRQPLSVDEETRRSLTKLRAGHRDLVRNTGLSRQAIRLAVTNIIGPNGVTYCAQVRVTDDPNAALDEATNDHLEAKFAEWGEAQYASANRRMSWLDIQKLAVSTWKQDGEAFLELLPGFGNKWRFAIQFWDADQLDVDLNVKPNSNGIAIKQGIETDRWGGPLAYHFWRGHPNDGLGAGERVRIPAERIVHLFRPLRPGQMRGIPDAACVMLSARMLHGYREAAIVAARTAASAMGFIQPASDEITPVEPGSQNDEVMEAAAGTFPRLNPGETLAQWDPNHPNTAHSEFTKEVKYDISSGYGISYMSLSGDLSDTSYSSGRMGLLPERDEWESDQRLAIDTMHRRVQRMWVTQGLLAGQLQLPERPIDAFYACRWQPRTWPYIDPEKDVQAELLALEGQLTSPQRITAERGVDLFEVYEEVAKAKKEREKLGIEPANPAVTPFGNPPEQRPPAKPGVLRMVRAAV